MQATIAAAGRYEQQRAARITMRRSPRAYIGQLHEVIRSLRVQLAATEQRVRVLERGDIVQEMNATIGRLRLEIAKQDKDLAAFRQCIAAGGAPGWAVLPNQTRPYRVSEGPNDEYETDD